MQKLKSLIKLLLLTLTLAPLSAYAQQERSQAAKSAFKYSHPCPTNGNNRGSCPGYVIDHIIPLACGGADDPSNMQWQRESEGKAKDGWERKGCSLAANDSMYNTRVSNSAQSSSSYYIGSKGGCFTYSASGKKRYVDHSFCR